MDRGRQARVLEGVKSILVDGAKDGIIMIGNDVK